MTRSLNRGAVAVGCLLALCACAAAQASSWVVVRGLAAGSQVEARLASGKTVQGKFVAASASGMELRTSPDALQHVPRAQIARIYLMQKSVTGRDALVGLGAGAAFGSLYGAAAANCQTGPGGSGSPNCPAIQGKGIALWGAVFGFLGAIAGASAGSVHRPRTLIYRRDSSRSHHGGKATKQAKPTGGGAPAGAVG